MNKIPNLNCLYQAIGSETLIVSAGMPRSGSTLLFNILRLVLSSNQQCQLSSGWIEDLEMLPKGDTYLVKTHNLDQWITQRAFRTLYSYRDIRDALVSESCRFGVLPSMEKARMWIWEFVNAKNYSNLMIRYEDLIQNIPLAVESIAKILNIPVDPKEIARAIPSNFDDDGSDRSYSKSTLLHKNHFTNTAAGDWRDVFDPEFQKSINTEFEWWFVQNSYATS